MITTYFAQLEANAKEASVELRAAFLAAGVNRSTFNRVLNGEYSLREGTAKKIDDQIQQLAGGPDGVEATKKS